MRDGRRPARSYFILSTEYKLRKKTEKKLGKNWVKTGKKLGKNWVKTGNKLSINKI